jgi:hypothetical protein
VTSADEVGVGEDVVAGEGEDETGSTPEDCPDKSTGSAEEVGDGGTTGLVSAESDLSSPQATIPKREAQSNENMNFLADIQDLIFFIIYIYKAFSDTL